MRIVLLGAPGCGKGTQGHRLAKHYKVPEISTGDLLREAVAAGTPLGKAAKAVMDAGQLVSDDIVLGVIRQRLSKTDARKGFILDGFPRNLAQAEQLDDLLDQLGQPIDLALVIAVDVDVILQRLLGRRTCVSCGASYNVFSAPPRIDDSCDECGGRLKQRADDNEETIGNRLRVYELQTAPVIQRYRDQGRLRVVQGLGEIGEVFKAVSKAIEEARPGFSNHRSAAIRRAVERTQQAQAEVGVEVPAAEARRPAKTEAGQPPVAKAPAAKKIAVPAAAPVEKSQPATKPARKPAKKQVTVKRAAGKAAAGEQASAQQKTPEKTSAGKSPAKKLRVKKKAASGKQVAEKPKTAANKKAVTKKKPLNKKKALGKKKAVNKEKAAARKPQSKKKLTKKATTKRPAKKSPAGRKAVAKKKVAAKKQAVAKKKLAKKPAIKKKVAKKPAGKKKAARKR
jgi:adenylate kinase